MRVIGGRSRGRRLAAKLPQSVRPTSDRVRESIFDILGSQGGVDGLRVIDLFCGSGALGVEALSRGAASVTFVDSDTSALAAVRENLTAVGLADADATLVRAQLPGWLRLGARTGARTRIGAPGPSTSNAAAPGPAGPAGSGPAFDLALCDPPYDFTDWPALLEDLDAATVVMESSSPIVPPDTWVVARERRYGGTLITVAHQRGNAGGQTGEDA